MWRVKHLRQILSLSDPGEYLVILLRGGGRLNFVFLAEDNHNDRRLFGIFELKENPNSYDSSVFNLFQSPRNIKQLMKRNDST